MHEASMRIQRGSMVSRQPTIVSDEEHKKIAQLQQQIGELLQDATVKAIISDPAARTRIGRKALTPDSSLMDLQTIKRWLDNCKAGSVAVADQPYVETMIDDAVKTSRRLGRQ